MLGKAQCNLSAFSLREKNPLSCVQFQLNSNKEHKEKVLSVTRKWQFWIFLKHCPCSAILLHLLSQGRSVNKLRKHKGTKKHWFCSMQSLCIPAEITTNPLLLLQTGPASCHGRIAMGTQPQEAPVGMQKTFLVFVLSPCAQRSDLGFEIIRLNFKKTW